MKILKLIISLFFITLICVLINSQDSEIDLQNYNFFGFNFNQSITEVKKHLRKNRIKYKERKSFYSMFVDDIPYIIFENKNWDNFDSNSYDFSITFFSDSIKGIYKYNVKKTFVDQLLKDIKNYKKITHLNEKDLQEYRTKNFIITYYDIDSYRMFYIGNLKIFKELWEEVVKFYQKDIYIVNKKDLRLYFSPYIDSKYIRILDYEEKVRVKEWKKIKNKKNEEETWVKVDTAFERSITDDRGVGDSYWILSSNLKKY